MDVGSFETKGKINPVLILGIVGVGVAVFFGITSLAKNGSEVPNPDRAGQARTSAGVGPDASGNDASGNPVTGSSGGSSSSDPCTPSQRTVLVPTDTTTTAKTAAQGRFDDWKTSISTGLNTVTADVLTSRAATVTSMDACLTSLKTIAQSSATRAAGASAAQADLNAAIEQTKSDIQVAKDRALLTKFPEYTRSYYDSWFPMDRPFRKNTIAILIGAALFFVAMSFLSVLSFMGFDTRIVTPSFGGVGTPLGDQAKQPLFLFVLSLLVVVGGLAIWGFTR